jgi:predicted methyltransferase
MLSRTLSRSLALLTPLLLWGCSDNNISAETADRQRAAALEVSDREAAAEQRLAAVLEAQPDAVKARYGMRHPEKTLAFFGIQPGMTVIEVHPAGAWYTNILVPFLGDKGALIGVDYAPEMYPLFGPRTEEQVARVARWPEKWVTDTRAMAPGDMQLVAFQFGALPESLHGRADAVLFIRGLHNLARFEDQGGFLTTALEETYRALRPGGYVGVVQHKAAEDADAQWANGSNGYLKQSTVIKRFEAVGFQLIEAANFNLNPLDQPTESDFVWRLPPALMTSADDPQAAQAFRDIGESTRMTLKFRKPL